MRTAEDIVRTEVYYCVSSLISTLAGCAGMSDSAIDANRPAWELFNSAMDLATPVEDWEEAIIQAGWRKATADDLALGFSAWQLDDEGIQSDDSPADIASEHDIDPYEFEVFEHWIVSDWLADELETRGEKVARDVAGMTIWARTTTGQAIYADAVFEDIARTMTPADPDE